MTAKFSSEPYVWTAVMDEDGEFEVRTFDGVHVVWHDVTEDENVVTVLEIGTHSEPLLTIHSPWWDFSANWLVIGGYVARGRRTASATFRMRPFNTGDPEEPILWKVEISSPATGETIDVCDPVTVKQLEKDYVQTGLRLTSKHHNRLLDFGDIEDEYGLEWLNRFQFQFSARTKHRGEMIDVIAVFSRSPIYGATRVLSGLREDISLRQVPADRLTWL